MGYEIHITRKENHFDHDTALEISLIEWENLVANDPELEIDPSSTVSLSNGEIKVYKWIQKSQKKLSITNWFKTKANTSRNNGWFFWQEGDIWTKNPSDSILQKMCSIAKLLNAKVQGDDGEIYDQ